MTTTEQAPTTGPVPASRRGRRWPAASAGVVAAGLALGVAELTAAAVGPQSSPVVAVGDRVITLVPEPVTQAAIAVLGQADKPVLVGGTLLLVALAAAALGLLALRRPAVGTTGILLLGALGALAALTGPAGSPLDVLPSLVGAAAGVLVLPVLLAPLRTPPAAGTARPPGVPPVERLRDVLAAGDRRGAGLDRRRFLLTAGAAAGVAAVTGGTGRLLLRRFDVTGARAGLALPAPASPAGPLPAGADLAPQVPGLTPLVTANRDFYRIDTALAVPQVDPVAYRLAVRGMVGSPRSYTLDDLLGRADLIERDVTLTCVSNEVGGGLAGTARWLGVPLGALLREVGVSPDSDQLVCRSVDGMTIGTPTRAALTVEDAMLAVGMNGEPLPVEHGFPVRMVIPGLYGYVSACKWLAEIEAGTYAAFDAYWVERGWAARGPVQVASRIDTPGPLRRLPAGRRAIAGVAWAQTRGIGRVEVRVDDGEWQEARLSPRVDADIWRQWVLPHDFAPGSHLLTVRATTEDGEVQTAARAAPFPSGATGLHSVRVVAT
ncbi:molybdopterin-dependent oxidoreductase [Geodermatophilus marinus]|uniref:molybdopterin-dependent oxidoreductase n=1 Tax=Geodermatophilus sp. LHW52908 TaxID=2303986 RepID=UPI000E3E7E1A|nr:molybdopterin-dependent oxidoreductase [Geodermatophilus sp. LHW52908]RFU23164.1 molybdopterin-binding oxidoreductase [Geodermatophilus sp. LHW52908]